jgi:hypothetical protein
MINNKDYTMSEENNGFISEYNGLKEAVKNLSTLVMEHHKSITELDNLLAMALNENLNLEKECAQQKEHIYILSERLESVIDTSSKGKKSAFRDSVESTLKSRISDRNEETINEWQADGLITKTDVLEKDSIFTYDLEDVKSSYQKDSMLKSGQLGKKIGDEVDVGNEDEIILVKITGIYKQVLRGT